MLLDGDGAFLHFPYPGALSEQPAFDMEVLGEVRRRWVALQNKQIDDQVGGKTKGGVYVPGSRTMPGVRPRR